MFMKLSDTKTQLPTQLSLQQKGFQLINTWRKRSHQRRALANLDAHLLDDIGVSRSTATKEIRKPFWR